MACHDQILVSWASTACQNTFLSDCAVKQSDPKSGKNLDTENLGCSTTSQRGEINPYFSSAIILIFVPDTQLS